MYLDFYGFKKAPFHITPDPEFLFLSPSHKTALGSLIYGIEERQGFVTLIGEVGLGKTTLLRSYLERVDQRQLKTIYIFHSNVSFRDLLRALFHEFGLELATDDLYDAVNQLHQLLVDEYRQARNVTLIVDEAHQMPVDTLEHLRMLSNLETSTQKLLQIVLAGQPELDDKLNLHELRQLKQRIVVRATISPLSEAESLAYVEHRLSKALLTDRPVFTRRALRRIIKEAKGTPRVLNILCTNALISGFGYQSERITDKIVKEVIAEYSGKRPAQWRKPVWLAGLGVAIALGLFLASPYRQTAFFQAKKFYYSSPFFQRLRQTFSGTTLSSSSQQPAHELSRAASKTPGKNSLPSSTVSTASPATVPALPVPPSVAESPARNLLPSGGESRPMQLPPTAPTASERIANTSETPSAAISSGNPSPSSALALQPAVKPASPEATASSGREVPRLPLSAASQEITRTVKRGDSLAKMATEVYGKFDLAVLDWVKHHNPHIHNVNRIEVGETITFPPLP